MSNIYSSVSLCVVAAILAMPAAAAEISDPERSRPTALQGSAIAWCSEIEDATADPDRYRDSPVYVGNPPTSEILRWAGQKPGFQELWIDRGNLGWITLGFTEAVEQRQAELDRRFPEMGVVAVEVPRTRRELRRLQERLSQRLFGSVVTSGATSARIPAGVVELEVNVVSPELVAVLEAEFPGEPLCVDGPDPADVVQPGPQPTQGEGWSLVGDQRRDGPPWFRTGIATTVAQLTSLWTEAGMAGDAPSVDFVANVVLWFAEAYGSSCQDQRLDGVIIDEERAIVHAHIVMPDNPMACTSDLVGAHHFFVALERGRLPAGPFWIQLGADDPPAGMPEERTVVGVDLSAPGSVVEEGDAHVAREQREPRPERSGAIVEPRVKTRYAFDTTCGIGYLGQINGIQWVTGERRVPAPWEPVVDEGGDIVVTVRLHGGPDPHVMATANGHSVRYEPVREAPPACVG